MEMPQGIVKFFDDAKGFGFIKVEGGKKDVFVHYSDIQAEGRRTLRENQKVEFEVVDTDKGQKAQQVVTLD